MKVERKTGLTEPYYFDLDDYKYLPLYFEDMERKGYTANEAVHILGYSNYRDLVNGLI